MSRKLIRVPRPEGGDERNVTFYINHNCVNAKPLKSVLNDPDLDLLQFSVGLHGEGLPLDVPFEVTSSNECGACQKFLRTWFQWTGQKLLAAGGLWTP